MPEETLSGCKVAILAIDGFNRHCFFEARGRLAEAGAITTVVSTTRDDLIRSWHPSNSGVYTAVDRHVGDVHPGYDALFLPGNVVNPESVFVDPQAADFVKSFFDLNRPIASLCRDRWLFVHRDNILAGRLKPEPPLSSEIVLSHSTPASSVGPSGSYVDLDGFIRRMLTFFQASLARSSRSVAPCVSAADGLTVGQTPCQPSSSKQPLAP